jgi:hypothetical protein
MKTMLAGVVAAAFVLALGVPAYAATETVKGQVVDQTCFTKDKANNGKDHKMPQDVTDCAIACAKKGAPLALLTADGKLYQLTGGLAADNNAKLVPHVSHTVEVTGEVTEKDGKKMISSDALKMISR